MRLANGLLLAAVLASASCASQHAEEPGVVEALDSTIAALQHADMDALWALTDPASQQELIALVRTLHAALQRVPDVYGDRDGGQVAAARTALGESLVDTIFPDEDRAGPKLLARLLTPDQLRFDGHAMDGVNHHDVTLDETHQPVKAIVHTSGGESFAFTKTEAGWRSLLVRDVILTSATVRNLVDNAAKIERAAADREAAWRQARDPKTPQGAYNVARAALSEQPANAKVLYSLLDEDARAAVLAALQRSREVQRDVQRRTTRRQRRKAYEDAGLTMYVDAKSDRELYSRWARTKDWKPPLTATDDPVRVDGDPTTGQVAVVTLTDARVAMVRGDDGFWHIAGQAPMLEAALKAPFEPAAP